ncbi:hypothetical protein TARUN_7254 [Trichoderma arundinaceum]|uniref:Uncharacterized protein n=1 Tax=Trichoderma arundinaceum TaxID=490622 RepID=A0A395NGQ4_TRIAR|nr:hypothetical protein TARUN_7254 [Trichoderma arundinaceum]
MTNVDLNADKHSETATSGNNAFLPKDGEDNSDYTAMLPAAPPSSPTQRHISQGGLQRKFISSINEECTVISTDDETAKQVLSKSRSLGASFYGINIIIPPWFCEQAQELSPYEPADATAMPLTMLGYGREVGIKPASFYEMAFMVEIEDEERVRNIITANRFGSLEGMLDYIYERLYTVRC